VASARFTALARDTQSQQDALGKIRYCTRIRGSRVEVSRYTGEADYSTAVLDTFDRFKQGAAQDYLIQYRVQPGMNHVTAQIAELVARLFPEQFTALAEYCRQHAAFVDDGIQHADSELQVYLAYLDYITPVRAAGAARSTAWSSSCPPARNCLGPHPVANRPGRRRSPGCSSRAATTRYPANRAAAAPASTRTSR